MNELANALNGETTQFGDLTRFEGNCDRITQFVCFADLLREWTADDDSRGRQGIVCDLIPRESREIPNFLIKERE